MKKNQKRTKIEIIAIIQLLYIIVLFIHCFNFIFTIDIHNSIIAKNKTLCEKRCCYEPNCGFTYPL